MACLKGTKMFNIEGLNIVVTGTSRGLGFAVANGLVGLGANVIGVGRSARPEDLAAAIQYFQGDISDDNSRQEFYEYIKNRFSKLNSLVNIAGISLPPEAQKEEERFKKTVNLDLIVPFQMITMLTPLMSLDGKSTIINFSSINASLGFPGNPGYVAAKSGLSGLTRGLAVDLASKQIRVNSISPGYFPTSITYESFNNETLRIERSNRSVLKRWGKPEELVGPVAFLCSDASSFITGHDLPVDGGWLIQGLK